MSDLRQNAEQPHYNIAASSSPFLTLPDHLAILKVDYSPPIHLIITIQFHFTIYTLLLTGLSVELSFNCSK